MSLRSTLLTALLLTTPAAAGAQSAAAPQHLSLSYDGRLYIKVLDLHFDEKIGTADYAANVSMASYGVLALFKHFDILASAQGRLEAGAARPGQFSYVNHDGKRVRQVSVAWSPDKVRMTSTPAFSNLGDPPAAAAQKLAAADPLTQMMRIVLTPPHANPCDGDTRYFDGKQLYDLDLVPAGGGELSDRARALGLANPVRCTVRYREIAGFKRKPPGKRDTGLGEISVTLGQFGANGPWAIASMEAETKLGHARIELREARLSGMRP
jgi:hypothetical protein